METNIRADLIAYAELFPDGHHLKEIALRTAMELGRENPFGRNTPKGEVSIEVRDVKTKRHYPSLTVAADKVKFPLSVVKWELSQVLEKYGLKAV